MIVSTGLMLFLGRVWSVEVQFQRISMYHLNSSVSQERLRSAPYYEAYMANMDKASFSPVACGEH